jgi:fructan beta-fructosidase
MYRHGRLGFEVGDGLEWHRLSTPDGHELPTGQWSHVVGTYDGDIGAMALYVNGEPVASADVPAGRFVLPSSADMIVGRHNTAAQLGPFHANMWNGLIDELRISSEVPTSEQVAAAYTAGLGPDGSLPVADVEADRSRYDGDRYRPQYHFVPPEHWMNEPHAPIYYDGQYHIFYQHNPQGPYWHQIHWGHAVSDDLVHWRDLPIALAPTKDSPAPDGIWSGSATHDAEGNPVLFFTAGDDSAEVFQRTGLARPLDDDLIDWEMHPEPVTVQDPDLHADEGEVWYGHFRDPFVWPETDESGVTTWYQLVTSGIREPGGGAPIGGTALVYTSTDLIDWEYHGPLFVGDLEAYPESSPIWELPVLLPIGEDADGDQKHIFLINPHWPGFHPLNAKTVAYWIGTWDRDAKRFIPDDDAPRLLDHGHHFTGPSGMVTPDGRTVMFTITQDGRSDPDHYDAGWAHSMGLPIELSLRDDGTAGVAPIAELESLRHEQVVSVRNVGLDAANLVLADAGAAASVVGRKYSDLVAEARGATHRTTAADLAALMSAVVTGTLAGPESTAWMLDLLGRQDDRQLTSSVPRDVPHGSKSGWVDGIRHDVAFVGEPGPGALVVAVCTRGYAQLDAEETLRALGAMALDLTGARGSASFFNSGAPPRPTSRRP